MNMKQKHQDNESPPPPPPLERPPIDETTEQTDSTVASNTTETRKKTPPNKPIRRSSQRSLASNSPRVDTAARVESESSTNVSSCEKKTFCYIHGKTIGQKNLADMAPGSA